MKTILIKILLLLPILCFVGCSDDVDPPGDSMAEKETVEKTVAVVLPMEAGLDAHWHRCLEMFALNFERAFKSQTKAVKLNFEYYDESTEDLPALGLELGMRDDVYAVIGGLYSSNSALLAAPLTRLGKHFFTIATSEELVRAYAPSGYMWAMVETDITQCEVLLSKVVNYGGKSVALIAREGDIYGKTFLDWFAFQAKELGLRNCGVFAYDSSSLEEMSRRAMQSGAEYVICVPSEIEEIKPMLAKYTVTPRSGANVAEPRLLFSDTGYGVDVLSVVGEASEGLEGVTFGADPESGFDISYTTFHGVSPTTGEAQLYDSAMLLGYAAWMQIVDTDLTLMQALRKLVTGEDINMGSWAGEDMSLVVDALARGDAPRIRGASGPLKFDQKIFTNVLLTTYYNYKIYNGRYIILDYNSSDGGNRTDATLAGWNWKASQMQEFENSGSIAYQPHTDSWALLVATSTGWTNYRHQADVLAIYRQLKAEGFPDNRIILILEDDIAFNPLNPEPGVVKVSPSGVNLYGRDVEIDYRLSELEPDDFLSILNGDKTSGLPAVVESSSNDNIFVFWSGHGVPGALSWGENDYGLTADMLRPALEEMHRDQTYRKLLMMVETCYSGSVFGRCDGIPGMLFITAANEEETSKADVFDGDMKVWMSNRFTSTFVQQIAENSAISMRDLYYRLFINTVGSHVMVYNAHNFGNLYSSDMAEFVEYGNHFY